VKAAEKGMAGINRGLLPGTYLVDAFPILKHIPEWFPGAGFKRNAKKWGSDYTACFNKPFTDIYQSFKAGTATPSFTASWLSKIDANMTDSDSKGYLRDIVRLAAGTAYLAGYETTSSTLLNFALLMLLNPGVQRKAHEELNRVVGRERLPDFADKESLAYIDAICKETLRYHSVLPLGIPHAVLTKDLYEGMRIPKGSIVFPNVWAMSRNKKDYGPDADAFRPGRFLEANVRDPATFVFKFGRRICPGRAMAENSLFLAISCVLHVFAITCALEEDGSEKPVEVEWIDGLVSHPASFPASFEPRFEGAVRLISTV